MPASGSPRGDIGLSQATASWLAGWLGAYRGLRRRGGEPKREPLGVWWLP